MMSRALASAQPVRPSRNERRYSTAWMRTIHLRDSLRLDHDAAIGHRAVGRADHAAGGDHLSRVLHERSGDPQQGVLLQQRVGVEHAHQGMAGVVERGVQGVGLLPDAGLPDHHERIAGGGPVHGEDLALHRQLRGAPRVDLGELVALGDEVEGPVGGSVVDEDHLEGGVPLPERGPQGVEDAGLLVVRRAPAPTRRG